MDIRAAHENRLGIYLKACRARLDPATFGLPLKRRRTPGLRREEVAQRAHISAAWYTWLEQGRGGTPSADALERIAQALVLTEVEREHLFLLGLGRPPEVHYPKRDGITPRLQRVLDALSPSPALVKTLIWDVVGWNRAATALLTDYAALTPRERNIMRLFFCNPRVRGVHGDREGMARAMVASFRADVVRAGDNPEAQALVDELCRSSVEFAAMWRGSDVGHFGEGSKRMRHPAVGWIGLEYSAFAVDGRPDLSMLVFSPATAKDAEKIRRILDRPPRGYARRASSPG